jgi:hypothetical protein
MNVSQTIKHGILEAAVFIPCLMSVRSIFELGVSDVCNSVLVDWGPQYVARVICACMGHMGTFCGRALEIIIILDYTQGVNAVMAESDGGGEHLMAQLARVVGNVNLERRVEELMRVVSSFEVCSTLIFGQSFSVFLSVKLSI